MTDTQQAQVGDTVWITITREGEVWQASSGLAVGGWTLDGSDRTVEILHRATPPLPSEPGTYWLDMQDDVWRVRGDGVLHCVAYRNFADPASYAPFRQLVFK